MKKHLLQAEGSRHFSLIRVQPMDGREESAPAVQLDRQLSPIFSGLLAFDNLIQIFGQSSSERRSSSGASFILTCVYVFTASLACPEQPGTLEITSGPFPPSCVTLKHFAPQIQRGSWNRLSQDHLATPLFLDTFGTFSPIRRP